MIRGMLESPSRNADLKKLARASAWALLVLLVLTAVAGFGITNTPLVYKLTFGLVDRVAANVLHRWSQSALTAVILIHVLTNIRLHLPRVFRTRIWLADGLLVAAGLLVITGVLYLLFNPY